MGTGYVVLAGLTEAQKSYLTIPIQSEVIEIANISEIEVKLGPVSPPANGEVRCRTRDLLNGLHIAQEQRKRLVLDEDAEVASEASSSRKGVVVIERVADASPVIAINYASSVGASVFLVDALSHKEGREVQRWIQDWKEDDNDCQLERVRNAVQQRIGNIDFARFEYATFFTEGLSYSFVLENVIPCSHVLLSVRPDMFIVTTFWMPKAYPFTLALCFRPCFSPTRRRTGCAISSRPTTFIYVL